MELGMCGIGLYWCIIECLYENNGYLDLNQIDLLAYELRVEKKLIEKLIDNYDLFKKNKKSFYSKSVLQRLEKINEISKKNKENIKKRWEKAKQTIENRPKNENDTTVLQTNYKEKEKKIKENKNKINKKNTITTTNIFQYIEDNFGRTISPVEYEKINSWLSLYRQEIIEYAVKIAVMNSKRTFNYIEGILKTWQGKNLETLDQIKNDERQFEQMKYKQKTSKNVAEIFEYDWLNEEDLEEE